METLLMPEWLGYANYASWVMMIISIVSMWQLFEKANKPAWASIVPVYNMVVFLQIIRRPAWWILLLFVPIVNMVILVIMIHDLVKAFGKNLDYLFGMIFLPFIFYPILAFGDAEYLYKQEINMNPDLEKPQPQVEAQPQVPNSSSPSVPEQPVVSSVPEQSNPVDPTKNDTI